MNVNVCLFAGPGWGVDADGARQPSAGRGREERNKSSVSEPRRQAARAVRERQSVVRLFVWHGGYRTLSKK